jgi:Alpha/beta hydrolase domain
MRRYDSAKLKSLYKDRNEYIKRFNVAVDQAVEEGRLVREDAAALKAPVVRTLPAF